MPEENFTPPPLLPQRTHEDAVWRSGNAAPLEGEERCSLDSLGPIQANLMNIHQRHTSTDITHSIEHIEVHVEVASLGCLHSCDLIVTYIYTG